MNILQFIQSKGIGIDSLYGKPSIDPLSQIPGRALQAMVTEQLDGAVFSIKKGSISTQAVIYGKVEVGKEYTFSVQKGESGVFLVPTKQDIASHQSLSSPIENKSDGTGKAAIQTTSLPSPSQTTQEVIQALVAQKGGKMPFVTIKEMAEVIDRLPPLQKEKAMELVKVLVLRNGLTNISEKLEMMVTGLSDEETTLQTLAKVEAHLQKAAPPTMIQEKLLNVIQKMQLPKTLHTKGEALQFIRQVLPLLGLNFENDLFHFVRQEQPLSQDKLENLKPLLLNYLNQATTTEEKGIIHQLVSKLTSFQLLTRDEGNLHHVFIPLPVNLENEARDWYVHISSKKKNETLDPEYCRIVLLLDLPIFSSVMVDVLVQGKVVSISFQHSYPRLETLVQQSTSLLKSTLAEKGYTLSAIKAEWKKDDRTPGISLDYLRTILSPPQEGVDLRI
ncbi:hypothetical protein [Bacillus sp. CHD6a]|uniref:hypothetical protein n=1 Tax=Bacillus sp. CHD6a TaxID=1643452 RepID=UPI0006CD4C10|nr:hypothetical protein [Bacillus sp. CHD6a]KPB04348.1 hypothetical protein AAV98_12380 [Bacillus sp. CHD6a]